MTECNVCANKVKQEKLFNCPYSCDYNVCKKCVLMYLGSFIGSEHCINIECKQTLNSTHLVDIFGKDLKTNKEYIDKQKKYLFKIEEAQFEQKQFLAKEAELLETHNAECVKIDYKIRVLKEKKKKLCSQLKDELNDLHDKQKININDFPFNCIKTDCRGIVKNGHCVMCKTEYCKKCYEVFEENHECDKNSLKTIKTIFKETKPCPECGTRIYKIDGCDQMWCTVCHIAFSWETLQKVRKGTIHNPHFFEYMRNNNINIPRAECQDDQDILRMNVDLADSRFHFTFKFEEKLRKIIETYDILVLQDDNDHLKKDVTLDYLRGKINKASYETALLRRKNDKLWKNEQREIIRTSILILDEIYKNNVQESESKIVEEMKKFMFGQSNEWLLKSAQRFNRKEMKWCNKFVCNRGTTRNSSYA